MKTKYLKVQICVILKNSFFLILIFSFILFLFFGLFFNDFKEKLFINAKNSYQLNIDKFTKKLEEKVILFDKESIELLVSDAKGTGFIQNIKIKLDNNPNHDTDIKKQTLGGYGQHGG